MIVAQPAGKAFRLDPTRNSAITIWPHHLARNRIAELLAFTNTDSGSFCALGKGLRSRVISPDALLPWALSA
jgi:hypothetical protein